MRLTAHRRQRRHILLAKVLLAILALFALYGYFLRPSAEAEAPMISPASDVRMFALEITPTPTSPAQITLTSASSSLDGERASYTEKKVVIDYMRQKFGDAFHIAFAVARVEGWPHKEGQGWNRSLCWHRIENGRHKGEYSVGIFQINIVQGCNEEGLRVHWNRIPGETLQEKIAWLSDPFNNIDLAHQIYTEQGFRPWTGFTSGNYLKYL